MKTIIDCTYIYFLICIASFNTLHAQVPNDDCSNAFDLDSIWYSSPVSMNCWNGIPADTSIFDSTYNSVINFPYPAFPFPCLGYAASVGLPSNDVWYKIRYVEGCDLNLGISNTDTLHLAIWFGDSCNFMAPVQCFTLIPGDTFVTIPGNGYSATYLQISGNGPLNFTSYNICLRSGVPCNPISYTGSPTQYICMDYNVDVTSTSSTSTNDGSINITINDGNPPYNILWNDGGVGFIRNNLLAGIYVFNITDSIGCITTDSIIVGTSTSLNETTESDFIIMPNPATSEVTIKIRQVFTSGTLLIYDFTGACVYMSLVSPGEILRVSNLKSGSYFTTFNTGNEIFRQKIIVFH